MSIVNYFFGYPGALSVPAFASAANLKMAGGVATADGYLLPRSYVVNRVIVTWSAANIGDEIDIDIMSGTTTLKSITLFEADEDDKTASFAMDSVLAADARLNAICYGYGTNTITDLHVAIELATSSASSDVDDVLPNIAIATADLQTIKPNITDYLKADETDFSVIVLNQKQELYAEIKGAERQHYHGYTNAELDTLLGTIRDYPKEQNLANRLKHMVVGWILMDNRLFDEGDYYIKHAKAIPLAYYIDANADSAVDYGEAAVVYSPRFGR